MLNPIMSSYGPRQLQIERGDGCYLYDEQGIQYFDGLCGIGVCNLGHNHPSVTGAIQGQALDLLHCSNLYKNSSQDNAAKSLCDFARMDNVFFANSGAEANEAALKLARLWGKKNAIEYGKVIVFERAFHGRTFATLSATGNPKVHEGFDPLLDQFYRAEYNDLDSVKALAHHQDIAAILVEPVQGEGGVHPASTEFLQGLRQLATNNNWLLMLDEVQTGNGRTGKPYAYMHYDITPDVITTAKGLGNGVPVGACMARRKAAELFTPGTHGSTYGGNPLVCSVVSEVVSELSSNHMGELFNETLPILTERVLGLTELQQVSAVRQLGFMIGIELAHAQPKFLEVAAKNGLLANMTGPTTIRLLPPLIMTIDQVNELIDKVALSIAQSAKEE